MKLTFFVSVILELGVGLFVLFQVRKRPRAAWIFIALGIMFTAVLSLEVTHKLHTSNLLLNFGPLGISILWLFGVVSIIKMVKVHKDSLVRLRSLQEIDQAILSSFSNNGVMNVVLDKLNKTLAPDAIGLFTIKKDGRTLKLLKAQNLEPDFSQSIIKEERFLKSILERRRPLVLDDFARRGYNMPAQYKVCLAAPIITKGGVPAGILTLYSNRTLTYTKDDIQFVNGVSRQIGIAFDREKFIRRIEELNFESVLALVQAIETRDSYTKGHSLQVANLAFQVGRELEFSERELELMKYAGLLHDIGKIAVPEVILQKPGILTEAEWKVIKGHPEKSSQIIEPLAQLQQIRPWIRHHHERWDGQGYPAGLKGNAIPLQARVLSVCDTYSAMVSDRPYRKRLSKFEAKKELQRVAGTQLDPTVVNVFLQL